jgi:hypothetical protein
MYFSVLVCLDVEKSGNPEPKKSCSSQRARFIIEVVKSSWLAMEKFRRKENDKTLLTLFFKNSSNNGLNTMWLKTNPLAQLALLRALSFARTT